MKVYELHSEQVVPQSRDEVFAFFCRPENLAELTPTNLGFQILTPSPIPMQPGTLIDYVIRIFGIPLRWRTLITHFDPPAKFVDEQLRGPYDFWHHTHTFSEVAEGTLLRDEVRYTLPLGPLGRLAHVVLVHRQLIEIFAHRRQVIARHFGATTQTPKNAS